MTFPAVSHGQRGNRRRFGEEGTLRPKEPSVSPESFCGLRNGLAEARLTGATAGSCGSQARGGSASGIAEQLLETGKGCRDFGASRDFKAG